MPDESTTSAATAAEPVLPDAIEAGQDGAEEGAAPAEPAKTKRDADALLQAAIRRNGKLKRERAELAREREAFQRERAAVGERLTKAERIEQALARARDDPTALSEFGVNYDDWTAKLLAAGTPDAKIELLSKKLDAAEELRLKRERLEQEREQEELNTRAVAGYVALSRSGEFPETELFKDHMIAQMGEVVGLDLGKTLGRPATHREIAAEVERQLVELETEKATARAAREAKKAPTSPTLTNRTGTESTGTKRELSKAEVEAERARAFKEWAANGL